MLKKVPNFVLSRSDSSRTQKSTLQGLHSLRPRPGKGALGAPGLGG